MTNTIIRARPASGRRWTSPQTRLGIRFGPGRLQEVGPAGFVLNQDAFQQGRFLLPVQAIITSADPVISIALGILWLNVRLHSSPADIVGQVVSLLLMITRIVITANYAPLVAGPAWNRAPSGAPDDRTGHRPRSLTTGPGRAARSAAAAARTDPPVSDRPNVMETQ